MDRLPFEKELRLEEAPMVRVHGALMAMIVAVDIYRSTGALPTPDRK